MNMHTSISAPRCLAIIPDGNRRWARSKGLAEVAGHAKGRLNAVKLLEVAFAQPGLEHVAFWAASKSNLEKRSAREVRNLIGLLKHELKRRSKEKIRLHFCGAWREYIYDAELADLIEDAQYRTREFSKHLTVLFGYSGEVEALDAMNRFMEAHPGERVTPEFLRSYLWTSHLPDVDLLIRTGVEGDPHDSDLFLPWQRRNTQLCYSQKLWPEFGPQDLLKTFADYASRARRAGA